MLLKKEKLLKLIEENKINGCTIIGKPTKELQEVFFSNGDLMELFKKYDIENPIGEFDHTPIGVYFPVVDHKFQACEICSITISKECLNEETVEKIISSFLVETFNYYQFKITPYHLDKIVSDEKINFEDVLLFLGDKQAEIARKIGKSRQVISDMKSGKCKCNIEVLALLMKEYPLLPWDYFIGSFINE